MNLDEQDQVETLMLQHYTLVGTTSVCRCGHNGYSTSGHLLHVYEVVQADVERKLATMPMTEMVDRLFKADRPPSWRYRGGKPPETG